MATTRKQKTASGGSVAGSLNALLPGQRASGAWCAIMSGFPLRWLVFILSCLPVLCFITGFRYRVPNRL